MERAECRRLRRELDGAKGGGEKRTAAVGRGGHALFDDLIRSEQQRRRDCEAEVPSDYWPV